MGTAIKGRSHAMIPHTGFLTRGGFAGFWGCATGAGDSRGGVSDAGSSTSRGGFRRASARLARVLLRHAAQTQTTASNPAVPAACQGKPTTSAMQKHDAKRIPNPSPMIRCFRERVGNRATVNAAIARLNRIARNTGETQRIDLAMLVSEPCPSMGNMKNRATANARAASTIQKSTRIQRSALMRSPFTSRRIPIARRAIPTKNGRVRTPTTVNTEPHFCSRFMRRPP